jgi:RNA polymerase sigma-70 factor (ECF subfamily)
MDLENPSDLLARIRTDETAFAELVARYQGVVRGFTALWAPSRDEADDLAQEVFLAALHSASSFDPSRDLKTWLLGIARNLTRQAWKRVARAGALGEALEREALLAASAREEQRDRRRAALDRCVEGLHERDRAVFREYVVEDLSSAELAARLATTEGTVRATISRIRRRLRACIERRLGMEPA